MASLKFYLDGRRPKEDGTAMLKLAIYMDRRVKYVSTGFYIDPAQWDAKRCLVDRQHRQHAMLNRALMDVMARAEDAFLALRMAGPYSLEDLHGAVLAAVNPDAPKREPANGLLHVFERFTKLKTRESTRRSYELTLRHVSQFVGGDRNLRLDSVRRSWLMEFDAYLAQTAKSANARAVYMRNLRAVFNFAIDEDLTTNYPFRGFKIKTVRTAKRSLSVEDLRRLFRAEVDEWQQQYVDFFRLSFCLIGMNPVDMLMLTDANVYAGRIEYNRSKTARLYSIKIEPEAAELIEKMRGQDHLLNIMDGRKDYLQYVRQADRALKTLGTVCRNGCRREGEPWFPALSMYWARHSWATIAASMDIPKDTIAAALGHGGYTVTDIYIDFDLRKVDEANRKVLDWVFKGV